MPRSSRNSQAAMASAIVPDESLRTFYTFNPDAITPSSSNNNDNDDDNSNNPMWTRRRGGGTTTTTTTRRTSGRASTSNMTDISVSSASLNSPIQSSSQAASEASSYTTRAIPGVIDEQDEQQQRDISEDHESDDDDDESDEVVVVARLSTLTANRGRRRVVPRVSNEDTPDGDSIQADNNDIHSGNHNHHSHNSNGEEEGDGGENGESSGISTSHFSSRLLDESEDDDLTNGTNGGRSHYMNNGDNDSLVDASPEEVEARAKEIIGWDNVGQDKDLYMVDLERWNTISEKHSTPGTAEYQSVRTIQSELLLAIQELQETEWMFPEPLPFSTYLPEPSSTIGQKLQTTLPFNNNNDVFGNFHSSSNINGVAGDGGGSGSRNWCDLAFNPLSTFTPLAPVGQATYPDTYRVQRALGAIPTSSSIPPPSTSSSSNTQTPFNLNTESTTSRFKNQNDNSQANHHHHNNYDGINNKKIIGYHGNAIPKSKPDFTWLESEVKEFLLSSQNEEEKSFIAKSKFPWAVPLSNSNSSRNDLDNNNNNGQQNHQQHHHHYYSQHDTGKTSMVRGNSMSLTREVGIIRLQ